MLQKPEPHIEKLLKHADFLDQLEPERFSMKSWGCLQEPRCICGWLLHNEAHLHKDDLHEAARLLGMDDRTAHAMFSPPASGDHEVTNKHAARALRHYAVTGEFNGW